MRETTAANATYTVIAAKYSAILGVHITVLDRDDPWQPGYQGWRVRTAGGYHADVLGMLVNWRLGLVPEGTYAPVPERFWCFGGRDGVALALAMGNAALFDGSDGWQPTGFTRAWDKGEA